MQLCVIAGSGYDCDWKLITTSQESVDNVCPKSKVEGYHTSGCADVIKKRVIVHEASMQALDYYGMIILWHEITHAYLYSDCYVKLNDHWKCYDYSYWHE